MQPSSLSNRLFPWRHLDVHNDGQNIDYLEIERVSQPEAGSEPIVLRSYKKGGLIGETVMPLYRVCHYPARSDRRGRRGRRGHRRVGEQEPTILGNAATGSDL